MSTSPKSESAIMIVPRLVERFVERFVERLVERLVARLVGSLVGVTRYPFRGDDVLVGGGEVEAAAGVHLSGVGAEELLPRGLVDQRRRSVVAPPFSDLLVGELDIEAVVGDVERDPVVGAQDRDVATDRGFRADVQNGRCIGGAALAAV